MLAHQKKNPMLLQKTMADYESRFNKIDTELQLIKWMLGGYLALSGTMVGLLINIVFNRIQRS